MEQEKLIELQGRLEKAKQVFKEMKATMAEKDARIQELEGEKQKLETTLNDTTTKLQAKEAELTTMENRWQNADDYVTQLTEEKELLVKDYDNKISDLENKLNTLSQENKEISMRNDELDGIATARSTDIAKLNEEVSKLNGIIDTLTKQVTESQSQSKILEDELLKSKDDNKRMKETVVTHVTAVKKAMQGLNDGLGGEFNIFG